MRAAFVGVVLDWVVSAEGLMFENDEAHGIYASGLLLVSCLGGCESVYWPAYEKECRSWMLAGTRYSREELLF